MLGTRGGSGRRGLALVLAGGAVLASACGSTTASRPKEFTTTTSTTRVIKTGPNEAWCKKYDALPDVLGSFTNPQQTDYTQLVATFTELRDLAPAEAKPDFVVMVEFLTKAADASKAGTLGASQQERQQWMVTNLGADGATKLQQALAHMEQVSNTQC